MTNKELQDYLKQFPDEMPVRRLTEDNLIVDMDTDFILHTSDTAFVDTDAPEDEWDDEDGKIELGDGEQYLLFNPIIV